MNIQQATSPYPGLRAFERHESNIFFGRENHIDDLTDKLGDTHFVAVLGTSGSGKSSLVRAGLLPALESGLLARAGAHWQIAELRPGNQAMQRLAEALTQQTDWAAGQNSDQLLAELERGPMALNWLMGVRPMPDNTRLLIVVDQFEELFRYRNQQNPSQKAAAEQIAQRFVERLLAAAEHPDCYIVITMRSDFLGECARHSGLPEAINAGLYLTPRLNPEQMADAIQMPARIFGGEVQSELASELLNQAGGEQDQLPLLQHALMRLWDETSNKQLTLNNLTQQGGLKAILDEHVQSVFNALSTQQQRMMQTLFRALVEPSEDERDTRRPCNYQNLRQLIIPDNSDSETSAKLEQAIDAFRAAGKNFLMPSPHETLHDQTTIDITHEALIRQWQTLQTWVRDEARQAALYQRADQAAKRWVDGNGPLWIKQDLAATTSWLQNDKPSQHWAARYGGNFEQVKHFIAASQQASEAEARKAEQQRQHEIKRARWIAFASIIALVVTASLAGWAFWERTNAISAEQEAQQHAEMAKAQKQLAEDNADEARRNAGLAEKLRKQAEQTEQQRTQELFESKLTHASLLAKGEDFAQAKKVLQQSQALDAQISAERRHARNLLAGYSAIKGGEADKTYTGAGAALVGGAAISRDGQWLAAAGERGTLVLFDAATGELIKRLKGHDKKAGEVGAVNSMVFDHKGYWLFSGGEDGRIIRWGVPSGEKHDEWEIAGRVTTLAISPDGATLASGDAQGNITLWNSSAGEKLRTWQAHDRVIAHPNGLRFSPDGKHLASASYDKTARIWSVETGEQLHNLKWHNDFVNTAEFSPDGKLIATASVDKRIVIWHAETGRPVRLLSGHQNMVIGLDFSEDGSKLWSASRDNTLREWDVASGVQLKIYQGHEAGLWSVIQQGEALYTASDDGTVRRWPLQGHNRGWGQWIWELEGEPISTAITPAGDLIAVGMRDGSLRLYELANLLGNKIATQQQAHAPLWQISEAHDSWVMRIAFNVDASLMVTAGFEDNTAKLWQRKPDNPGNQYELLHTLRGHINAVFDATFSPDGKTIATASYDGHIGLFDVGSGQGELFKTAKVGQTLAVAFDHLDERLMSVDRDDRKIRLWNVNSDFSEPIYKSEKLHDLPMWASWRPDGRQLAAVGREQIVTLLDLPNNPTADQQTDHNIHRLVGHENAVFRAIYSPDGQQLATVAADETVRLWDLHSNKELFSLGLPARGRGTLYDFDFQCTPQGGCWIAVPLTVGRLALYHLPYEQPPTSIRNNNP